MLSLLLTYALLTTCWCMSTERQQSVLSYSQTSSIIHVRNATSSDIDDITRIVLDAFASDPEFRYQYQFREQYPRYHFECARQSIKLAVENTPDNIVLKVIDVPPHDGNRGGSHTTTVSGGDDSAGVPALRVGALAIWDYNTAERDPITNAYQMLRALLSPSHVEWYTSDCAAHLDLNMTRVNITTAQFEAAKHKYIDTAYDSQLYLALLATHPIWQNQGFGPANLAWGLTEASKLQIPVTLIATPAGYPVYVDTGFDSVANITINRVVGDQGGAFWYEVMEWFPVDDGLLSGHL